MDHRGAQVAAQTSTKKQAEAAPRRGRHKTQTGKSQSTEQAGAVQSTEQTATRQVTADTILREDKLNKQDWKTTTG